MSAELTTSDLLAGLKSRAAALGLRVHDKSNGQLSGEVDSIRAKWLLGAVNVRYSFSCRLDEAARTVRFREAVQERSWGFPPPTFQKEIYAQRGADVSITRVQKSLGGGGTLEFGQLRDEFRSFCEQNGWRFDVEVGRAP